MSVYLTLSDFEKILTELREAAERYRERRQALEALEERWAKFVELAKAFGVELKLAEDIEFYAGGALPNNDDFINKINRTLAYIRRIKQTYGDLKIIVDLDINIKKIMIKV
ncbi:MAG: hypothetical protein TU35_000750 [Thermoproteus sp. AZ2]|jgi:sugar phosphate isomerase/epimerase|uniref:Uncharacterized protein n=1 Tax=Thermoproteus sp. AZ2 TaxID=1609232 RepID=A0ACC6UYJ4_9CREN|nr:MAG: hypothetical protein TU35_01460 [Thermoproteus sp. AZ2]